MDSPEELMGGAMPPSGTVSSQAGPNPSGTPAATLPVPTAAGGRRPPSLPPAPPGDGGGGDEEDGMLRMSFLEHLEELRSRIIRILIGVAVAFGVSLTFCYPLWKIVSEPAVQALKTLGYEPNLVVTEPMEAFNTIWVKIPLLCSAFLASPWILYQVWAFISPGLYRRERRWAAPFILCSAGLFITGGLFAYFVAFRYGLTFLLGLGQGYAVRPMITISTYSSLFFNVILGVGLVFELPILIFFLTLLRIVTPQFLIKHSRYAILLIFVIAAVVTPTPDAVNMMIFATPMVFLFFVGIFASYLLVLSREGRGLPWKKIVSILIAVLLVLAVVLFLAITKYGLKVVPHWPFLAK